MTSRFSASSSSPATDQIYQALQNEPAQVGVTGFCMGGALAIASSVLVLEVDVVVAFYGVPPPELADPVKVKVHVQAHFVELDKFDRLPVLVKKQKNMMLSLVADTGEEAEAERLVFGRKSQP